MEKIKVIAMRPGGRPVSTNVSPSLSNLQRYVGGYVEAVNVTMHRPNIKEILVLCDEEGLMKPYHFTVQIAGHDFYGDIILCGRDGCEFTDLPYSFQEMKEILPELWERKE